jgi:hypothetical protein
MIIRFSWLSWLFIFFLLSIHLRAQDRPFIPIYSGMEISGDILFVPGKYVIDTASWSPIIVEGENIDLNFNDAQLIGCPDSALPHQYTKTAIICRNAKNITIRNLRIARFQTAILVENCENVRIENCDISYMYRTMWMEDISRDRAFEPSRLLPHYAAVSVENCKNIQLTDNYFNSNLNSVKVVHSSNIQLVNNFFLFNAGKPVSAESCKNVNVLNNRFDFNFGVIPPSNLQGPIPQSAISVDGLTGVNNIAYNGFSNGDAALCAKYTNTPIVIQGNTIENMRYAGVILDNAVSHFFSNLVDSCEQCMQISGPCRIELGGNIIKNVTHAFFFNSQPKEVKLLAACNAFQGIGSLISVEKAAKLKKKLSISFKENHIDAFQLADKSWANALNPCFSENVFYQAAPKICWLTSSSLWPLSARTKNYLLQNYPENLTDSILRVPCQTFFPQYHIIQAPANGMSTSTGLYQGKTRRDMKSGAFGPFDYRYPILLNGAKEDPRLGILGPDAMSYTLTIPVELDSIAITGQIPDTIKQDIDRKKSTTLQADLKTYGQNGRLPNGTFISAQDTITRSYLYLHPIAGYRLVCHYLLTKEDLEWTFAHWSELPWEQLRPNDNESCECVAEASFRTPKQPSKLVVQSNMECEVALDGGAMEEFQINATGVWTKQLSLKTDEPEFKLKLNFKPEPGGNYLGFRWLHQ